MYFIPGLPVAAVTVMWPDGRVETVGTDMREHVDAAVWWQMEVRHSNKSLAAWFADNRWRFRPHRPAGMGGPVEFGGGGLC